jgi:hypothetical protein
MHYNLSKSHQKNIDIMESIKKKVKQAEAAKYQMCKILSVSTTDIDLGGKAYFMDRWTTDSGNYRSTEERFF